MTLDLASFPTGPLVEKETFSKPGTADVTASDLKKVSPLVKHYAKMAHPFSSCKRDQMKHGLSEDHANRRCSVIKSLGKAMEDGGTVGDLAEAIGWEVEQLDTFVAEQRAQLRALTISLGPGVIGSIAADVDRPDSLAEADAELYDLAEQAVVALQIFGNQPIEVAEAYTPPSWVVPKQAKRPGFKPLDPPKKAGSSSSSYDEKKHPRDGVGQFLRKGQTGPAVSGVQKKLGIKATGTYDNNTVARIKRYQKNHGLQVDGVIGSQTAASLLGKTARAPGKLPSGLRTQLQQLSKRKLREDEVTTDQLEERTLLTAVQQRDNGIKSATHSSIRSAVFDLSDRMTPTHTVKLPNGTTVKVAAAVQPSYGSYGRTFEVSNGSETLAATGVEEAADTAKELDSRQPGASGTPVSST